MSLFFRKAAPGESRSLSFQDVFSRGGSLAVFPDSVESSLRLVPVYAATRLIAEQFASTPMHAYRSTAEGLRERLPREPSLLAAPSAHGSVFDWKYRLVTSLLLRGNAYGLVTSVDASGWPTAVEWLNPDHVDVVDEAGGPAFYFDGRRLDRSSVVHLPAYALPGRTEGVSPLKALALTVETGQRAQQVARDWFANGTVPGGHLKNTARTIDAEDAAVAKERFTASVSSRGLLVTGQDWTYTPLGVPADEARFIESMRLTATQIATVYGIPPEMVGGETGTSMTYASVEQQSINFVNFALRPWFCRVEEALSLLLPRGQFVRFNMDALIRADTLARYQAHEIALRTGLETLDEGRALENRPPLTDEQKADMVALRPTTPATTPAGQENP